MPEPDRLPTTPGPDDASVARQQARRLLDELLKSEDRPVFLDQNFCAPDTRRLEGKPALGVLGGSAPHLWSGEVRGRRRVPERGLGRAGDFDEQLRRAEPTRLVPAVLVNRGSRLPI
jgi:hypothetical protein